MVQIQSEAGQRLHDALVNHFGPIEDGHGRKVYGHKRTSDAWRAAVLADLRGEALYAEVGIKPDTSPPSSADNTEDQPFGFTLLKVEIISNGGGGGPGDQKTAHHMGGWEASSSAVASSPSAAQAGRAGRTACLVVLLAAAITACVFNDAVAAAVSAGPIPLLWHGLVGRAA